MIMSHLSGVLCTVLFTFSSISVNAALFGRLPATPGGVDYLAYYDDQLDITWTADANINSYDSWNNHVSWADGLALGGASNWRLPNMDLNRDSAITSCASPFVTRTNCMDNEYGHLFYYGAGTTYGSGITPLNPGPFSNVVGNSYWSGTEAAAFYLTDAWLWEFEEFRDPSFGRQGTENKENTGLAWAVHSGDVGVIPVPGAVWLFGTALLGLLGLARSKRKPSTL